MVFRSYEFGTPPFIEPAMIPTYEAALAAGDCGCLTAQGFLLFTKIHLAAKEEQEDFWTKLTSMNTIWSKQSKVHNSSLPPAKNRVHTTAFKPDGSADHAEAEGQPLVDNFRGIMYPEHPLDVRADLVYAPSFHVSRDTWGTWGTFDVEKALTDWTTARPGQASDEEIKEVVYKHCPPLRYAGFHEGFVDEKQWFAFALDAMAMRRQAISCLRIEVVVCSPRRPECQKLWKSGGVYVHVRCTCCGELCTIMTEFDEGCDGDTMTGFKVNGDPIGGPNGKPIDLLTVSDLLDADEHKNARGECGGQLRLWFYVHASHNKHKYFYVHHAAHCDIHFGGMTHGGSPRFYCRTAMPGPPVALGDILLPRAGLQG
jgi:hypothetical protein